MSTDFISKYYGKDIKVKFDVQQMVDGNAQDIPTKMTFITLVTSVTLIGNDDEHVIMTIPKTYMSWGGMFTQRIQFSDGKYNLHLSDDKPIRYDNFFVAKNVEIEIMD